MLKSITLNIAQKYLTVSLDSWNADTAQTTCLIHPKSLTMRIEGRLDRLEILCNLVRFSFCLGAVSFQGLTKSVILHRQ